MFGIWRKFRELDDKNRELDAKNRELDRSIEAVMDRLDRFQAATIQKVTSLESKIEDLSFADSVLRFTQLLEGPQQLPDRLEDY